MAFPQKLRDARLNLDLTQKELAEAAGIHPVQVSHLENGRHRPTTTTLKKLSAALGVSPRDLAETGELANAVPRRRRE